MIEVRHSDILPEVKIITVSSFEDFRGQYIETYNSELYSTHGIDLNFVQDDISVSGFRVLRGLHGDDVTWKLISCLFGSFYLVVVNCKKESADFGKWEGFTVSDTNCKQILVPPNYGNGHLVLTDKAIFHYKQTTYYDRSRQFTYKWDDHDLNIWWPIADPILSRRDAIE